MKFHMNIIPIVINGTILVAMQTSEVQATLSHLCCTMKGTRELYKDSIFAPSSTCFNCVSRSRLFESSSIFIIVLKLDQKPFTLFIVASSGYNIVCRAKNITSVSEEPATSFFKIRVIISDETLTLKMKVTDFSKRVVLIFNPLTQCCAKNNTMTYKPQMP